MDEYTIEPVDVVATVPVMYRRCAEAECILEKQAAMEAFVVWIYNGRSFEEE